MELLLLWLINLKVWSISCVHCCKFWIRLSFLKSQRAGENFPESSHSYQTHFVITTVHLFPSSLRNRGQMLKTAACWAISSPAAAGDQLLTPEIYQILRCASNHRFDLPADVQISQLKRETAVQRSYISVYVTTKELSAKWFKIRVI